MTNNNDDDDNDDDDDDDDRRRRRQSTTMRDAAVVHETMTINDDDDQRRRRSTTTTINDDDDQRRRRSTTTTINDDDERCGCRAPVALTAAMMVSNNPSGVDDVLVVGDTPFTLKLYDVAFDSGHGAWSRRQLHECVQGMGDAYRRSFFLYPLQTFRLALSATFLNASSWRERHRERAHETLIMRAVA